MPSTDPGRRPQGPNAERGTPNAGEEYAYALRLPRALAEETRALAARNRRTFKDQLICIIEEHLRRERAMARRQDDERGVA